MSKVCNLDFNTFKKYIPFILIFLFPVAVDFCFECLNNKCNFARKIMSKIRLKSVKIKGIKEYSIT